MNMASGTLAPSPVAVLFARADSVYKGLPGCDVWDAERDARLWQGGAPVVAHPPCRAWGRLRAFAKPRPDEMDLARFAVQMVRRCGGVLEHPAGSLVWADQGLPRPGQGRDAAGGWSLAILQHWWGHRAEKPTWLYIVGAGPRDLPTMPMVLGPSSHVIQTRRRDDHRPHVTKAEREHTPADLAEWLVQLARSCRRP